MNFSSILMRSILHNRFTILLGSLLAFVLIVPPSVEYWQTVAIVPCALSVIVLAIVLATREGGGWLRNPILPVVALGTLFTMWTCRCVVGLNAILYIDSGLFAILLFSACGRIAQQLTRRTHVNRETLAAATSIYVLFGMAMSRVYWLTFTLTPAAFHFPLPLTDAPTFPTQPTFLYYSFMVMTTVGFGDVVPVSALARSLTVLHSIVSVFYLAITISRLVSLYRNEEEPQN